VTHRWGIVGPGGIAAKFAEDLQLVDDGELVAVASRSSDRAEAFGDRFSVARRYGSYDELAADPLVDVVYIATPHARHEADTLQFVAAGKHVLCEKPFALNEKQARRMADAARGRGVFLMEAMWSRFLPSYVVLRDLLDEEQIGDPLLVESDFGFRMPVMVEHRLFDRRLGGGALLDLGIYPVQLCSLVLGEPDRVVAAGVVGDTGVDEQIAAVLHYSTGSLGVVKAAIRVTLPCGARIAGSGGSIELPPFAHRADALVVTTERDTKPIDASFTGNGLHYQVQTVHRCLDEGKLESSIMPLDESVAIARTLDAIRVQVGVTYPDD
jgi:predicted dehydrogenase